ncbi:bifunctional [glutamine synthetase] adenylyltransferase/[glutamine synthetase]-adenylyl-L-tyrosine phosphorylase [Chelatococcus reniformis]|uniref:Bifunctional glutamine synthetase adenylyltransferase/adenylyl-removing enzyme n=1 Tax=Chelatococcus reniformis TaxID=1494448 RepID=A0A916UJ01_9HYPH|nr:bifunctional [glutamine synthetase] adenylyltransferase/[glutamine synthetase]-adenylyl-L-tyrosine phosphorylase [Chelatococcus reniformis]GGC73527.1 glutamate-ammonia-ligase adenylyltransferase [Chelatococcus reniformis]
MSARAGEAGRSEAGPLRDRIVATPKLSHRRKAEAALADLVDGADGAGLAAIVAEAPRLRDLLLGVLDHSPFLARLACADRPRLLRLVATAPESAHAGLVATAAASWRQPGDGEDLMRQLRQLRAEAALLVALADLGGLWSVEQVTGALTVFADACVGSAVRFLLAEQGRLGRMLLSDAAEPEAACGLVVLALGKHGAGELNYSSDIDLVVFYDPAAPLREGLEPAPVFLRLTQALVKLLQERTADGYVFRVDLRLRPDPGSTSPAISLPAAFTYYETVGQNWERAAFIKARPIAGDLALGARFLEDLGPFIWRKYFDFATIADIHAMKRQIHVVKGHDVIALAGHDIKLGRGGIREIEFFVQTQQLVFGGRRPALRGKRTLDMLGVLAADGWITPQARDDLSDAYRFLRRLEHRLQMVGDQQTQRLPTEAAELADIAKFAGFASTKALGEALTRVARTVQHHYALLFEEGPALATEAGSLVFTGTSDDPDTLETLVRIGFRDPACTAETIRGWHFGRRAAVTSPRAREVLTELTPALLAALGRTADPDGALAALDAALARMPAAVELLSMLRSNERLLNLFADLLGSAPRLAEIVSERPHVLDVVIDPAFTEDVADLSHLADRVRALIGEPASFEEFLDRSRDAIRLVTFMVGARMLSGIYSAGRAGEAFTIIAETAVASSFEAVSLAFAREHGVVPGGRAVVLGLGRLGSREMTASSDLDLVLLYDYDAARSESDGARPLHASVYYNRLTQRLLSALTVPTRRGRLYEVDMRLRPEGRTGPVATQFKGFVAYHREGAETWERMALTRARVIAGDAELGRSFTAERASILRQRGGAQAVAKDVLAMRALVAKEKGDRDPWDLKLNGGGLMDIEFIAQFLVLAHAAQAPSLIAPEPMAVLAAAERHGFVEPNDAALLRDAHELFTTVLQWQRLAVEGAFDAARVAPTVLTRIAAAAGLPDVRRLQAHLADTRKGVRGAFNRLLA